MEEAANITEKRERARVDEESSLTKVYDISKNPIFYFQEAIRAILNCLGFESSKPESSSSSSSSMSDNKEEENNKEEDDPEGKQASTDNNNDNPNTPSADDPPQTQALLTPPAPPPPPGGSPAPPGNHQIEAATRRGRTPPRPGVSRGSPPQNN